MSLALFWILAVVSMALWHLRRRARRIREQQPPPHKVRWPEV